MEEDKELSVREKLSESMRIVGLSTICESCGNRTWSAFNDLAEVSVGEENIKAYMLVCNRCGNIRMQMQAMIDGYAEVIKKSAAQGAAIVREGENDTESV